MLLIPSVIFQAEFSELNLVYSGWYLRRGYAGAPEWHKVVR